MLKLLQFQDKKHWALMFSVHLLIIGQVITDLVLIPVLSAFIPIIAFAGADSQIDAVKNIPFLLWTLNFDSYNEGITVLVSVLSAMAVTGVIFGALAVYVSALVSVNLAKLIRSNLFIKIQSLAPANLDRFGTSSLVTRLTNDVTQIQAFVFNQSRIMIRFPIFIIGGIIFSLLTNLWLSISIAIIFPIVIGVLIVTSYYATPLFKKTQKAVDSINIQSRESLLGIRVIKSFNLESNQREKFALVNKEWTDVSTKAFRIMNSLMPIAIFIANLGSLIVLIVGRFAPASGIFDENNINPHAYTQIFAFLQYQGYVTMGIIMTITGIVSWLRCRVSVVRINELLNETTKVSFNDSEAKILDGSINFQNVSFRYWNNSKNILTNLSFSIKQGEVVGIIGPTGSGKTSLVNLIARLYDANNGAITVGTQNIKTISITNLSQEVGYVLQENILFSGTIRSNLMLGNAHVNEADLNWALDVACASDFINKFPDGLNHQIEQRGRNLSGGQKQRLTIARAILRRPKIIILDDSTSALDTVTDKALRNNLKNMLQESTTIIVSQKISSIKTADKIIVLENGCIVGNDTHDNLLEKCNLYREIAESQMTREEISNE